jgi:hypothetical protein
MFLLALLRPFIGLIVVIYHVERSGFISQQIRVHLPTNREAVPQRA